MKNKIKKLKLRKIDTIILIVTVLSFILGILFLAILSESNKELVATTLNNFFTGIKTKDFNYNQALFNSLSNNITITSIIWLLGISIIGIPIVILILISKSFILGFSISSIIYNYGLKGILIAIIYIIPHVLNLFITIILAYYSMNFSIMLFNLLFRKKEYTKRLIVNRYIKILVVSTIFFIISSILEVFIIPRILVLI